MSRTFIRQDAQIRQSVTYDDTVAPTEAAFETNPTNLETDLNNIRSQVSNLMDNQAGDWFTDLNTPAGGTQRGVNDLNTDLNDMETKKLLCPTQVLTNVTVGGADNFVVLSDASSETPTDVIAIALTQLGAVTAALPGVSGTHSLNEITGANALSPKNIVWVRDATSKDAITSGGQEIFGLLQVESAAVDGTAFDDTTQQGQISFVINSADDLVACPAVDIQGKVVEYTYGKRITLDTLPEDCTWPAIKFADRTAAASDVTRQNAYDNQGATAVNLATNATLDLEGAGLTWIVRDDLEAALLTITEGSAGGTSAFTLGTAVDTFDSSAIVNDFDNGASFDTGAAGTTIDIGVTAANTITSGGSLTMTSAASTDLSLVGAREMFLDDGNQSGSTWAQTAGVKLSDTTGEWDAYEVAFGGEVSLLNAIVQANDNAARTKGYALLTSNVSADTDVSLTTAANLDADLPDFSGVGTFVDDVDVYLNGELLRNGANAAANNDVYPGTTPADGQLRFEFSLHGVGGNPDTLAMIVWSS